MSDTTPKPDRGWWFPARNRGKAHYADGEGRSLCGKWVSIGVPDAAFEPDNGKPSRDDCAACRRALDKRGVVT